MQPHQQAFVELLVRYDVIRFGEFTLKSGRKSPYFVNAGQLRTGRWVQYEQRAHNDLYVSLLNLFGDDTPTFGNPAVNGGALSNLT